MKWYLMVLKNYANFNGRARRKEFWMFLLFNTIVSMILAGIGVAVDFPLLSSIYSIAVLIPSIAVGVRRMHDVGKSGWYYLIPFYNLYLMVIDGVKGENKYGADPKNRESLNDEALDSHLTA